MAFDVKPDGEFHTYEISLSDSPEYRGVITGLRFDPADAGNAGGSVQVRAISLGK